MSSSADRLVLTESRTAQDVERETALSAAPVPSQTHPLAIWQLSNDLPEHKTNPDPDTGREEFYYTTGSELHIGLNLDLL